MLQSALLPSKFFSLAFIIEKEAQRSSVLPIWLYGKHISPSALVFNLRIWFSFDDLYLFKSTFFETTGNEICGEEHEIDIDFLIEKLVQVDCFLTNVVRTKK